jgi:ERCC4-related helicase
VTWALSECVHLQNERIPDSDGLRQQATAAAICERLQRQPGLVLADEVGMGKTFVAFAVATSILYATDRQKPVVVMMPPAVAEKWPRDWTVFKENCLDDDAPIIRATPTAVRRGSDFLKLLDDPPARRFHIVFLTHGALSSSLNDPFIKLAIVRHAFRYQRRLSRQKAAFCRWADRLLNDRQFTQARVAKLLDVPPSSWRGEWRKLRGIQLDDDPVPSAATRIFGLVDLGPLREALANIPLKNSANIDARLALTRLRLAEAVQAVWAASLRHLSESLPLLVLDEAHHVKNPTALARLFESKEALRDAEAVGGGGPLGDVFERMLFLTATPFQLGHRELLSVLGRFSGARAPEDAKRRLSEDLARLTATLDSAQAASLSLDHAWGRLKAADLDGLPDSWWSGDSADVPDAVQLVAKRIAEAGERIAEAEAVLRPWVVRHTKEKARLYRSGQQIVRPDAQDIGLELSGHAIMPFLLTARAQAIVSLCGLRDCRATRAYFAEGLASSFEAFRETRAQRVQIDDAPYLETSSLPSELTWYLEKIEASLPEDDIGKWSSHPKVQATTQEVVRLWSKGEKVLVFCFYRATGKALRTHISRALTSEIVRLGAESLGLEATDEREVLATIERRADSLLRAESPGARKVLSTVEAIAGPLGLSASDVASLAEVTLRFFRTASFLVRFMDLGSRQTVEAIDEAFEKKDGSGVTLRDQIASFARFLVKLTDTEREGLWQALSKVQTGSIATVDGEFFDPDETAGHREGTLPNVRLANGGVKREIRERLMRTFNTPFFPEVLVASSVMGEGVDLQVACRHVLHHDLDWNPSTLEQRTGRIDRLGSKAAQTGTNIIVYEPYIAGTQDEKMYRVVKDREKWFKVLMGEQVITGEWDTDRLAERQPLPDSLLEKLVVDLRVHRPDGCCETGTGPTEPGRS